MMFRKRYKIILSYSGSVPKVVKRLDSFEKAIEWYLLDQSCSFIAPSVFYSVFLFDNKIKEVVYNFR